MYAGKIVEQARTSTLFGKMRHPYTESLLRSIPRVEDPSHTRLRTIIGRPPNLLMPPPGCSFAPRCPYAQDRCHEEVPVLEFTGSTGHRFACFYPLGTPENAAALQTNLSAGLPQALALLDAPHGASIDLDQPAALDGTESGWAGGEAQGDDDEMSPAHGSTRDD
jgi:peptide/nickel transport system ATP-binding protein